jgi:hypothetical protein
MIVNGCRISTNKDMSITGGSFVQAFPLVCCKPAESLTCRGGGGEESEQNHVDLASDQATVSGPKRKLDPKLTPI